MRTFSFSSFFLLSPAPMIIWASLITILVKIGDPDDIGFVTSGTKRMIFSVKIRVFSDGALYSGTKLLLNE